MENVLQMLKDSELMKRYTFDCAGIMFVVCLIRNAHTSSTRRRDIWKLGKCNNAAMMTRICRNLPSAE